MLISFECPHCQAQLEVDAEEGGARCPCPACRETIRVPIPRVEPGTTLGNFRIEKQLGSGGMGDVFLALQVSMQRPVALKVLPHALTRDKAIVERFLNEVRMSARLEHPNIVTAFEAGEDHGYYFLAMSYVDGEDLGVRLRRDGPLPEKQALAYAIQIARALGYAWDQFSILHRDIKPGNIMIDRSDTAKLMDMGISKSLSDEDASLTIPGMVVGTPFYMSPEQARTGIHLDFRSDMYALGATLYHLVTGTVPYTGDGTVGILTSHAMDPFPFPRDRNPAVSYICGHLLHNMMAKSPDERYASWNALITDMERVIKGLQPLQPRPKDGNVGVSPSGTGTPGTVPPPAPSVPPVAGKAKESDGLPPVVRADKMLRGFIRRRKIRHLFAAMGGLLLAVVVVGTVIYRTRVRSLRLVEPSVASVPDAVPGSQESVSASGENRNDGGTGGTGLPKGITEYIAGSASFERFLDQVVDELLEGRGEALQERIQAARQDPELEQYGVQLVELGVALKNLHTVNRYILESFRRQIGEQVNVGLKGGTEALLIRSVAGDRVSAMRTNDRDISRPKRFEFSVADLTITERLARLEPASRRPAVALSMGMTYLRKGDYSLARDSFLKLPADFREAWLRKLNAIEKAMPKAKPAE